MRKVIASFAFVLLLSACVSSVQLAPSSEDVEAKRFISVAEKSVVYVIQNGGLGSYRAFFQVTLNGQYAAALSGNTYSRLVINPGKYRMLVSSPENQESINFESKAGEIAYFGAQSTPGWAQMRVDPIKRFSTQEGKNAVLESGMAASVNP